MDDHDPFLDAILEYPDNDEPRLVYADWLEERGDVRGEFIKIQCELARPKDGCRCVGCYPLSKSADRKLCRTKLRRREGELAGRCAVWAGKDGVTKVLGADHVRRLGLSTAFTDLEFLRGNQVSTFGNFYRGFVEEVTMTAAQFFGGPCEKCGGHGQLLPALEHPSRRKCPSCHGEGRIEGLVAALFTTTPIVKVRLGDREPERVRDDRWRWLYAAHGLPTAADLPLDLLMLTPQDRAVGWTAWQFDPDRGCWVNEWTTRESALSALSVACVKYGRLKAKEFRDGRRNFSKNNSGGSSGLGA